MNRQAGTTPRSWRRTLRPWRPPGLLLALLLLVLSPHGAAAQEPSAGQGDGAALAGVKKAAARHALWLRELGDPKFLDAAGIASGLIPAEKMRDPRRANLAGRKLANLELPGIVLRAAELSRADLSGANLSGGNFSHAAMAEADLSSANLEGAQLRQAVLKDANLAGANLTGADLRNADLGGADLSGANLAGAKLSQANLEGANLAGANLNSADLTGADLTQAVLANADLENADLSGAQLIGGNLRGAGLKLADLSGAQLYGAVLDGAFLFETNLSRTDLTGASLRGINLFANNLAGARMDGADLAGVVFEPGPEYMSALRGNLESLVRSKNLGLMTFYRDSRPLEELSRALSQAGYRRQELEITYALRRGLRQKVGNEGSLGERLASLLQYVFLELPIEYGASPYRPFGIICVLVAAFGLVYMIPLLWPSERFGQIWKVTPKGRFFTSNERVKEEVLKATGFGGLLMAFWFSFLSAFNIGGRIFNVDDLFIHCQSEEYTLRGTRWVRSISGVQALVSVYLLVLMLLVFLEKVAF